MGTHADKMPESKQQTSAAFAKQQSNGNSTFQLISNRPEAIAQRRLRDAVNDSPQVHQMKSYQAMANGSPRVQQLRASKEITQRKTPLVIQRVIDEDDAYAIATHIVDQNATIKAKKLKSDAAAITNALTFFGPAINYTNTPPELALIKEQIEKRKGEVKKEKQDAEVLRKAALSQLYAMNAVRARAHLDTMTAQQIGALGAKIAVFRTYRTSYGLGSEYMFNSGQPDLAQFVVHVHWNVDNSRSGVRFKSHTDKTKSQPGMVVIEAAKADALGLPGTYGAKEREVMEE